MLSDYIILEEAIIEVEEDHRKCLTNHKKCIDDLQIENEYLRRQLKIHQDQLEILRKYTKKLRTDLDQSARTITDCINEHTQRLIKIETRLFVNDHSLR